MKKYLCIAAVLALFALLLVGCRNMNAGTGKPATSATTQTTLLPAPEITLPLDTVPEHTTTLPDVRKPHR